MADLKRLIQTLKGAMLVLRYLAHAGSAHGVLLYGSSPSQAAQVDFFLDLSPLLSKKDTLEKYATELNEHLAPRTTLVAEHHRG